MGVFSWWPIIIVTTFRLSLWVERMRDCWSSFHSVVVIIVVVVLCVFCIFIFFYFFFIFFFVLRDRDVFLHRCSNTLKVIRTYCNYLQCDAQHEKRILISYTNSEGCICDVWSESSLILLGPSLKAHIDGSFSRLVHHDIDICLQYIQGIGQYWMPSNPWYRLPQLILK